MGQGKKGFLRDFAQLGVRWECYRRLLCWFCGLWSGEGNAAFREETKHGITQMLLREEAAPKRQHRRKKVQFEQTDKYRLATLSSVASSAQLASVHS